MKLPTDPYTEYTSPQGRKYRVSSIEQKDNGHWVAVCRYIDDNEIFHLEADRNDKIIKTWKQQ